MFHRSQGLMFGCNPWLPNELYTGLPNHMDFVWFYTPIYTVGFFPGWGQIKLQVLLTLRQSILEGMASHQLGSPVACQEICWQQKHGKKEKENHKSESGEVDIDYLRRELALNMIIKWIEMAELDQGESHTSMQVIVLFGNNDEVHPNLILTQKKI